METSLETPGQARQGHRQTDIETIGICCNLEDVLTLHFPQHSAESNFINKKLSRDWEISDIIKLKNDAPTLLNVAVSIILVKSFSSTFQNWELALLY